VPEIGLKIDAVPGRLNQFLAVVCRLGRLYGQCSELCGVSHGFMPIVVDGVTVPTFSTHVKFLAGALEENLAQAFFRKNLKSLLKNGDTIVNFLYWKDFRFYTQTLDFASSKLLRSSMKDIYARDVFFHYLSFFDLVNRLMEVKEKDVHLDQLRSVLYRGKRPSPILSLVDNFNDEKRKLKSLEAILKCGVDVINNFYSLKSLRSSDDILVRNQDIISDFRKDVHVLEVAAREALIYSGLRLRVLAIFPEAKDCYTFNEDRIGTSDSSMYLLSDISKAVFLDLLTNIKY
jgi:hypothetical protein